MSSIRTYRVSPSTIVKHIFTRDRRRKWYRNELHIRIIIIIYRYLRGTHVMSLFERHDIIV